MARFFDKCEQTGIIETFEKDAMTGKISIQKTQDVDPFFEANLQKRNNSARGWAGDWHHVASVPPIQVEIWREELKAKGATDPNPLAKCNEKWLIAKLNSRDFTKLRTKTGRI